MNYSREMYNKALKTLERRKEISISEQISNKEKLYKERPRVKELEQELGLTATKLARAVLNGGDVKKQVKIIKRKSQEIREEINNILLSLDLPLDYLETKYFCPQCKDSGFINGKMCDCLKKILSQQIFDKLNNSSPLSVSSFEDFSLELYSSKIEEGKNVSPRKRMRDIFNYCKKYAQNFGKDSNGIIMQGNTGLGKTHLSLAIAADVIAQDHSVVYGSAPALFSKLEKEHFGTMKLDETDTEDALISCDLLIIDDLGTEFLTNFISSEIYNILNSRILTHKPTIISTNLSIKEIEDRYSQRFVSRIIGSMDRLEFLGNDLRQKLKNQR